MLDIPGLNRYNMPREGGNWCEGLTTYCSNYLMKETRNPADAVAHRNRAAPFDHPVVVVEPVDHGVTETDDVTVRAEPLGPSLGERLGAGDRPGSGRPMGRAGRGSRRPA